MCTGISTRLGHSAPLFKELLLMYSEPFQDWKSWHRRFAMKEFTLAKAAMVRLFGINLNPDDQGSRVVPEGRWFAGIPSWIASLGCC